MIAPAGRDRRGGRPLRFSAAPITRSDLRGRRVTVMGLGLFGGGRELTRFLCEAGADVLVTDLRDEVALRDSIVELDGLPIRWVLGRHREEDFLDADMVFANPAVPRTAALLESCHRRGIPLETEMNLFLKLCPGRICAVTGSNGKTTTTSLLGHLLAAQFPRTRLGGNMGRSLLGEVSEIRAEDRVVLELSSFQLEDLSSLAGRPEVSVVTNASPNHLDRHRTYEEYLAAKRIVLEGGGGSTWAILNGDDTRVRCWGAGTTRRVAYFGRAAAALPRAPGVWLDAEGRFLAAAALARGDTGHGGAPRAIAHTGQLKLRGRCNQLNAAAALAAALAAGAEPERLEEALATFEPLEHRLEFVVERGGVRYFNDSIATTPESTLAAIEALGPDLVLVAGGSDKGVSFRTLGRVAARRTRAVVLIGSTATRIAAAVREASTSHPVVHAASLEEAVQHAAAFARPGDNVALSPACASYDMFRHFADRGLRFKALVREL